jgi:hypothetical protein
VTGSSSFCPMQTICAWGSLQRTAPKPSKPGSARLVIRCCPEPTGGGTDELLGSARGLAFPWRRSLATVPSPAVARAVPAGHTPGPALEDHRPTGRGDACRSANWRLTRTSHRR